MWVRAESQLPKIPFFGTWLPNVGFAKTQGWLAALDDFRNWLIREAA